MPTCLWRPRLLARGRRRPSAHKQHLRSLSVQQCCRRGTPAAAAALAAFPLPAGADWPLSYLQSFGDRADAINALLWFLLAISLAVIAIAALLLLGGIFRRPPYRADRLPGVVRLVRTHGGETWLTAGIAATVLALAAASIWTVATLAQVSSPPPGERPLRLKIVGHQWWWDVVYLDDEPRRQFRTSNEIHVPTGQPVEVELASSDVIHSFWIPALNGKTDVVPGQRNKTWFTASRSGIYRGQCTEYCGRQHAHMGMEVVAQAPDEFRAWQERQITTAPEPVTVDDAEALRTFTLKCGVCHAVRGTPAGGVVGPDLSHLMARRTIAAGAMPNTIGSLSAWIADPQHVKPGSLMPAPEVSGPELTRIVAFLQTLK